jgi:hypothetical protein
MLIVKLLLPLHTPMQQITQVQLILEAQSSCLTQKKISVLSLTWNYPEQQIVQLLYQSIRLTTMVSQYRVGLPMIVVI